MPFPRRRVEMIYDMMPDPSLYFRYQAVRQGFLGAETGSRICLQNGNLLFLLFFIIDPQLTPEGSKNPTTFPLNQLFLFSERFFYKMLTKLLKCDIIYLCILFIG